MIRSSLVVLGAILFSGLFMAIGGFLFANSPEMALMMRIAPGAPFTENDATELWKALDRLSFIMRWIESPLIAASVGLFVGFFAKQYPVRLAVLGITPYAAAFARFDLIEIGFTVGYVLITGGIAAIVFRGRQNKERRKNAEKRYYNNRC